VNRLATASLAGIVAFALAAAARAETPSSCPKLDDAERLVLVLSPGADSVTATVRRFERNGGKDWRATGKPKPAVLGKNGMAWAWNYQQLSGGARIKAEGDGRTPAGFFPIGKPFGFSSGPAGYVRLAPGENYCVDDPASPHYNAVVTKAAAGGVSGEDMGTVSLYRQGLFIDYPTNRALKGGSCIFLHTWRARSSGTSGCVALTQRDVEEVQRWSEGRKTVIGILPQSAWKTLRSCFPGI
jgi:L,D-peptidoglycan transpeptidase YkuD (ErfK/YbiS/YcfS/YnhG family)